MIKTNHLKWLKINNNNNVIFACCDNCLVLIASKFLLFSLLSVLKNTSHTFSGAAFVFFLQILLVSHVFFYFTTDSFREDFLSVFLLAIFHFSAVLYRTFFSFEHKRPAHWCIENLHLEGRREGRGVQTLQIFLKVRRRLTRRNFVDFSPRSSVKLKLIFFF